MKNNHKITKKLVDFIIAWESLHDGDLSTIGLQPKLDAAKPAIWTEGYGQVVLVGGKPATVTEFPKLESILPHSVIKTKSEAKLNLLVTLDAVAVAVRKRLKIKVSEDAFNSLVSHAYNCGLSSTMYRLINSKVDEEVIKEWYLNHYIAAGGEVLKGLQLRRKDEYEMRINSNYERG